MDAFSRLLVSIGQSLGKGLGQVGQTELEQRQRLEVLEAQRKANISSQLLQTFTQLLQTQGIQEVAPGGIEAIRKAVTDLALGKIDSPSVQEAISVFPTVAQAANKIAVYRELATKDIDALSRLIANTDPKEAQTLLKAIGLQGMYEGLRSRGEILTEADRLGLQLTREQIENLAAQRKALLAKLEPEIRLLDAQLRLVGAQADEIIAKLPLVLTRLQLEAQNLAVQIRKGEIEVSKLDQILDAQIKKDLAQVGVSEAQAAVLREQINLIREQVKSEVLRQAQIEAETELIKERTELTKAEAEVARARARQITETLGPTIQNLLADVALKEAQRAGIEADITLKEAQTAEIRARTKAILDRLPLELENLLLDIKRKGIELERLPDILDAELKERFAKIGLTEAQTGLTEANIDLIREQTKSEILRQLKTEAETEKIKAETEEVRARKLWVEKQAEELDRRYQLDLARGRADWFKSWLEFFRESGTTNPDIIKAVLTNPLEPFALPEAIAEPLSRDIAARVKQVVTLSELQLVDAVSKASASLLTIASQSENPEEAKKFVARMLPEGIKPELREFIGDLAKTLNTNEVVTKHWEDIKRLLDMPPPPKVSESGLLKDFYAMAAKRFGKAYANSIVNLIKSYWDEKRKAQELELAGKSAEAENKRALALYYSALASALPQELRLKRGELALKREEFDFEKWLKTQQVEQGWARIRLEELELLARQSADKNIADLIVKLTNGAKNMGALGKEVLAGRLATIGAATCAQLVKGSDAQNLAEMIAGVGEKCNKVIEDILKDKNDPVAVAFANAMAYQQEVIETAITLLGGPQQVQPGATPGTTRPGNTSPTQSGGTRPSGTAAPGSTPSGTTGGALGSDFASGAKAAYNMLKGFGVQIPNDFKEAGAMVFTFGTEQGKRYNPFEIKESSGVTMREITIEEGGQKKKVKVPVGPDKGFREAIKADKDGKGARQKALDIDSAIAFGIAWIFPNEADKPSMLAEYIREDFRRNNPGLFRRAEYFKSKEGYVDIASVAAAYASMSLERLGVRVQYTKLFTTLLRVLAENDLDMLRVPRPLPPEKAKERYLNMVKSRFGSDRELLEDARKRFGLPPNAPREKVLEEILKSAASLYDATRLSNIGRLVLGGGR